MKAIKKCTEQIAITMILLMLLASCTVYQSQISTLDQAVQSNKPVKVITKNGDKMKYQRIVYDNGTYYAFKREKSGTRKFPFNENYVQQVYLKDKSKSTFVSIAVPVVAIGVPAILVIHTINTMPIYGD